MKKWNVILLIMMLLLNFVLLAYVFINKQDRRGYVNNHKLFEAFAGKKELEKKLKINESAIKGQMDSLLTQITSLEAKSDKSEEEIQRLNLIRRNYQQTAQYLEGAYQEKAAKYTEEIWKQINTYMQDFGREKGYDYIYGVAGMGSLMYGNESHDITEEAIKYVNEKYQGH